MRISDWSSDVCSSDLFEHTGITAGSEIDVAAHGEVAAGELTAHVEFACWPGERTQAEQVAIQLGQQIGRASCRERVCQYVSISVVAVSLKKKIQIAHYNKTPYIQAISAISIQPTST